MSNLKPILTSLYFFNSLVFVRFKSLSLYCRLFFIYVPTYCLFILFFLAFFIYKNAYFFCDPDSAIPEVSAYVDYMWGSNPTGYPETKNDN